MSATNTLTVSAVLSDPKSLGFRFSTEVVKTDGRTYPAEIPVVEDVASFDAAFPGLILRSCNGQSIRVGAQAVCRNARGQLKTDALRAKVANWLLGIEDSSPKTIYIGPEGAQFSTQEEATAAWLEFATK